MKQTRRYMYRDAPVDKTKWTNVQVTLLANREGDWLHTRNIQHVRYSHQQIKHPNTAKQTQDRLNN